MFEQVVQIEPLGLLVLLLLLLLLLPDSTHVVPPL